MPLLRPLLAIAICFVILPGCKKKNKDLDADTSKGTSYDFSWSPKGPIAAYPVTFSSTAPAGSTYLWTFGDGNTSVDSAPQHTYGNKGLYTATLTINNDTKNVITKQVNVGEAYWMAITGSRVVGDTMHFSTGAPAGMSSMWTFGDGSTSTDASPWHIYTKTGSFQVKVILSSSDIKYYAPGNGNVEIVNDPLYTNKIPSTKTWHLNVHMTSQGIVDTSFTDDETLQITLYDKITLFISGGNYVYSGPLVYDPALSKGNVLVYRNKGDTKLYYDHLMDTSYIQSNIERQGGPGNPIYHIESHGRP